MSRVLARSMFKKNAPKRSAKGVGITSMLEDDVAGYNKGGEVTDDRTERERLARQLLEQNRDEGDMYQRFAEQERPQMYRPAATTGMMQPQPNPQQMQAMQMQQMAQMGMLPRFQQGGQVNAAVEVPSMWSRIKDFLWNPPGMDRPPTLAEMRRDMGRSIGIPSLTNTGISSTRAVENPNILSPVEDPNALTPAMGGERKPFFGWRESDVPEPPSSGRISDFSWGSTVGLTPNNPATGVDRNYKPSADMGSPAGDMGGIMGGRLKEEPKKAPKKAPPVDTTETRPAGPPKATDLGEIKSEREAKAAAARQENIYLALMQAGLAIAGGKSSNAIANIGQGGQAGLASFMALEQQRRRDEDAAMRRDLAEREYGLQVRRQQMQEPYYQAQTEYLRMRPQIAADKIAADQQKMLFLAKARAEQQVYAEAAKNPMLYMGQNGKVDPLKVQLAIRERTKLNFTQDQLSSSGNRNGLGLELPSNSDNEE